MGYNTTTGVISAPVSIADVQQALGEASNDLATLCTSSKINKWSFYKPVISSKLFDLTDVDIERADGGFQFSEYTTETQLTNAVNNKTVFKYNKPIGGSSSVYRLGDFKGYNANSTEWFPFTATLRGTNLFIVINSQENLRAKLGVFDYWENRLPSTAGIYSLMLYAKSSTNSYLIPITDVANIGSETTSSYVKEGVTLPSGTYQCLLGIGDSGIITNGNIDDFAPFTENWVTMTVITLDDQATAILNNMTFTMSNYDITKVSEGGGFYDITLNSMSITVVNNNTEAVNLYPYDYFCYSGTTPSTPNTLTNYHTIAAGATATYTYGANGFYGQATTVRFGMNYKVLDVNETTITKGVSRTLSVTAIPNA